MLDAAKKMPTDPNFIYSRTMNQINSRPQAHVQLANRILMWLTFAGESLTSQQLVEALAIEDDTKDIDPMNAPSPTMFTKVCRGLVVMNESNNSIQLAHRTVQDYLENLFAPDAGKIHHTIWAACLTYLSFEVFQTALCTTPKQRRQQRLTYCFAQYAASNLGRHLAHASKSDDMLDRMYAFITCKQLRDSFIQMLGNMHDCFAEGTTELHVAVIINEFLLLEYVLTMSPHLLNSVNKLGRTALGLAVERGSEEIVRSLLNAGATLHQPSGETLLNCAARNGHNKILERLISHEEPILDLGVQQMGSPRSRPTSQERQLFLAVIKKDQKGVQDAILQGIDLDARDIDGGTPLQWAAWYGCNSIIEILLDHGADVNAADLQYKRQALHEAAEQGNLSTARILLEHGAEVNGRDVGEWSPLHGACVHGGSKMVALLLSHGAELSLKTSLGDTALDLACMHGQLISLRILLKGLGESFPGEFNPRKMVFMMPKNTKMQVYEILKEHLLSIKQEGSDDLLELDIADFQWENFRNVVFG